VIIEIISAYTVYSNIIMWGLKKGGNMMKKIILWITIFLFNDAELMHGMALKSRVSRFPAATKTLPTAVKTLPSSPQPTQPISPDLSSTQPVQPKVEVSPFLSQKKLLSGLTVAAQSKVSALGQYVRNWFNNVVKSWFSASFFATASKDAMVDRKIASESIAVPESQNLIVSGVSNASSPFATGIQKRQYSAAVERQPSSVNEPAAPMEKSAVQMESEEIIKALNAGRSDERLFEQIKTFFVKNNVDDIENVFMYFINRGYDLGLFGQQDSVLIAKIENLKQRWFEKMGWFGGADIGDILFDHGSQILKMLPTNVDSFVDIADKIFQARSPVREGYRVMDIINTVQNLRNALMRLVINKIENEHDAKKIEKLCVLLRKHYARTPEVKLGARFMEIRLGINNNLAQIPSVKHLRMGFEDSRISGDWLLVLLDNPYFAPMVQQILHKEKELIDQNYEVFYHARRWQYGFLTDVYDMLYEYKSGKELHDFMFTQLDDPVVGKVSDKFYVAETEIRKRLMKEGNPYDSNNNSFGRVNRQRLLFLNKFLFGNLRNLGSCSMYYFLRNANIGDITFSVKEIFNMFGLNDAYQAFADELQQLQKEHNTLSKYGEMLQIAIPKDNVDKSVYHTEPGGPTLEFALTGDGEKTTTTDIKTILADLDKNPQDIAEFVLVETRDKLGGLNPESGIKVFSYNTVEPAKLTAFKEKEKALFERIQNWMRKQKQDQAARE
jgi:hypothetical protein